MTPQEQLNALMDKIEKEPQVTENWLNLSGIFLSNKLWDPFVSLFNQREMMLQDGAELMIQMLFSETVAMVPQLHTALLSYDKTDLLSSNQLILRYAASAMQINSGEIEKGREGFLAIEKALKEHPAFGDGLPHLNSLGNFSRYFKTFDELENCQFGEMTTMNWLTAQATATSSQTPIVATSISLENAEEEIKKFCSLFDESYPKHFHISEASQDDMEKLQKYISDHQISFSSDDNSSEEVSLFLRSGEILARQQRALVLMNRNITEVFDVERLFLQADQKDITLFKDLTIVPWLSNNASFIYLKNSEYTMQYLFKLTALLSTLENEEGPIVGSILNCLNQYADAKLSGGSVQLLDRVSGYKFEDFFKLNS
ncbi:hypothetical protein [Curvivirga sp.]|uniref:hypothetical protein n=1 Tax=Curvivirga sp. TaxID=2856848 RepID=UPI003B58F439